MLASLMRSLDDPGALARQLGALGRGHRKYGVTEHHYAPFLDCLLATIRQANGPHWTAECEAAWRDLLGLAQRAMTSAAADDSRNRPAWWTAEVVRHEQRCPDVAVVSVRPDPAFGYLPGQYLSVQVPRWPRGHGEQRPGPPRQARGHPGARPGTRRDDAARRAAGRPEPGVRGGRDRPGPAEGDHRGSYRGPGGQADQPVCRRTAGRRPV